MELLPPGPGVGALVGQEQVELSAGGHGVLAQRVLPGQVVADDARQADLVFGSVLRHLLQPLVAGADLGPRLRDGLHSGQGGPRDWAGGGVTCQTGNRIVT